MKTSATGERRFNQLICTNLTTPSGFSWNNSSRAIQTVRVFFVQTSYFKLQFFWGRQSLLQYWDTVRLRCFERTVMGFVHVSKELSTCRECCWNKFENASSPSNRKLAHIRVNSVVLSPYTSICFAPMNSATSKLFKTTYKDNAGKF